MKKLISLTLFLAILVGVDIGAKSVAEGQLRSRAEQEAPPGSETGASISSFPFLGRLLLLGTIRETSIELRNVSEGTIVFARVALTLRNVEIDRGRLIRAQEAEIVDIASGTVTIEVTQEALSERLNVPIAIGGGSVRAAVGGQEVAATPSVQDGLLTLTLGQLPPLRVRIPTTNYAPCVGEVTALAGRLRFSCTINDVPPAFLGAANRAANR